VWPAAISAFGALTLLSVLIIIGIQGIVGDEIITIRVGWCVLLIPWIIDAFIYCIVVFFRAMRCGWK
jgi:hypothetical protein